MLKQLPQGERYLSGTVSEYVSDSATSFDVNNPPATDKLPTYIELEPDSDDNRELLRVIGVSGNTITVERGLDNGGVGTEHQTNSAYKQKITSRHWSAVVDSIESGYLSEDTSFAFSQVSSSTFRIVASGDDRTSIYTAGRRVRLNGSTVCRVVSSSYSNPNTDVIIDGTSVPATITSIEVEIGTENNTNSYQVLDEDTMASDSATALATQQSIKAYVDNGGVYDGWIAATDTWTYASATTFTIAGVDRTAMFPKGTKLKLTNSTVKYFYVVGSAFSTDTTITVTGGSDYTLEDEAITSPYYSYASTPQGFPTSFSFTFSSITASGSMTIADESYTFADFSVSGGIAFLKFRVTVTLGGTASTHIYLNGLPIAPAGDFSYGSGIGYMLTDGFTLRCSVDQANDRISVGKYDGSNLTLGGAKGPSASTSYLI